jgi:hypothetical protein
MPQSQLPPLDWIAIPDWPKSFFPDAGKTGLLKFTRGVEIVYIGMETKSLAKFRRFATPGGSAKRHAGGRRIYTERDTLTLEYALLDRGPWEIRRVRNALCALHRPQFNVPNRSWKT